MYLLYLVNRANMSLPKEKEALQMKIYSMVADRKLVIQALAKHLNAKP
jgi:hypothetical protein